MQAGVAHGIVVRGTSCVAPDPSLELDDANDEDEEKEAGDGD